MTALDLATDILVTIGEVGAGQSISPEDGAYCLTRINAVLDSWSQEEGYIFSRSITAYPLTANVGTYAIGPTEPPPFNTPRPTKIDFARILIFVSGQYIGVKDMRLITAEEFASYSDKSSTSIVPEELYYDNGVPSGNLHLFDIPNGVTASKVELTTWNQLQQLASLATVLTFPPGYYEAMVMAIGVAVSPAYNKPVDQATAARAQTCTERIKRINQMILRPGVVPVSQQAPGQPQAPQIQ